MYDELEILKERINRLPNEELLRMVNIDFGQYRQEALDYARAEMQRRGLKIEPVNPEDSFQEDGDTVEAEGVGDEYSESDELEESEESQTPKVEFKTYRGVLASWNELFSEAAAFATEIGPLRLINISHSLSFAQNSTGMRRQLAV